MGAASDVVLRSVHDATNSALKVRSIGGAATVTTCTKLEAVGSTAAIDASVYKYHTFQIKVAAINTNVVVKAEGSLDGTDYFNMDDTETNTTITANGTYLMHKANFVTKYVRFTFVSEAGGSNATINVVYLGGSQMVNLNETVRVKDDGTFWVFYAATSKMIKVRKADTDLLIGGDIKTKRTL